MRISESEFRKVIRNEVQNVLQEQGGGEFPADISTTTDIGDDFRFIWEDEQFQIGVALAGVETVHVSFTAGRKGWDSTFEMEYNRSKAQQRAQRDNTPLDAWLQEQFNRIKSALRNLGLEITGRSEITDRYLVFDGIRPTQ